MSRTPRPFVLRLERLRSSRSRRGATLAGALFALLPSALPTACVAPENPCDPAADPSVRETSSLSGRVVDDEGNPVAGVTVLVAGRGETTISQSDGSFALEGLPPNEGGLGYELVATPTPPLVGGRAVAPPLTCQASAAGLELVVVRPPATPEAEVVLATAPDRLFVAFASSSPTGAELMATEATCAEEEADEELRYRVEVRPPFGTWQRAVLSDDPRLDLDVESGALPLRETVNESCSRSLCLSYAYALPSLEEARARCAEVVGVVDESAPSGVRRLERFGSYQVRVVAERATDARLHKQQIPDLVRSPDTAAPAQTSLAPTALMPVALAPDPAAHEAHARDLDIGCIVPVSHGRFAMIDGTGLQVIGQADHVAPEAYEGATGMSDQAMAYDPAGTGAAADEVAGEQGVAAAILPSGRWVRVWKRMGDPALGATSSKIEKVFIGAQSHEEAHAPAGVEPRFELDVEAPGLEGAFQGFSWLTRPAGRLAEYDPPDNYVLLFRRGFVLLEREDESRENGALLATHMAADFNDNGGYQGGYAGELGVDGSPPPSFGGFCSLLGPEGIGVRTDATGARLTRVCFFLAGALGEDVDLRAVSVLAAAPEVTDPTRTLHVFLDAIGDRALAVRTDRLAGAGDLPLTSYLAEVPLGVAPTAVIESRVLSCREESGYAPALLVANQGSQDVSVLQVTDPDALTLEEVASIPLPSAPLDFFADPDGPSCEEPYVWVLAEDGRAFPLDLRAERLEIPACGPGPCSVATRGRGRTGAVSRDEGGRARVVVGGRGLLSEVGFLRPGRR